MLYSGRSLAQLCCCWILLADLLLCLVEHSSPWQPAHLVKSHYCKIFILGFKVHTPPRTPAPMTQSKGCRLFGGFQCFRSVRPRQRVSRTACKRGNYLPSVPWPPGLRGWARAARLRTWAGVEAVNSLRLPASVCFLRISHGSFSPLERSYF